MTPENVTKSKRGLTKYDHNPFLKVTSDHTKSGSRRISNKAGNSMMVIDGGTGEIVAPAGFWQYQEVDKTQFVKLYINGVKAFKELTGAGTKVFEVLYIKIQSEIGKDSIYLSYVEVDQAITPMSKATFMKGMKELILKGFIAESIVQNKYYLNPDYMWNGDRLAFVKEFRLAKTKRDPHTIDMIEGQTDLERLGK